MAAKVTGSIVNIGDTNQCFVATKSVEISSASYGLHLRHEVGLAPSQLKVVTSYCLAS